MSGARSTYTKGEWYLSTRIQPGHDSVFSGIDEDHHTKRRAQLASGVSRNNFASLRYLGIDQDNAVLWKGEPWA